MEAFDNFNRLRSNEEIQKGRLPYDSSEEGELNDLGNLDIFHCTIRTENLVISWYNYNMVSMIYRIYIRRYGEDFIKEKARRIKNKTVRAWIFYALKKYPDVIEDLNDLAE